MVSPEVCTELPPEDVLLARPLEVVLPEVQLIAEVLQGAAELAGAKCNVSRC